MKMKRILIYRWILFDVCGGGGRFHVGEKLDDVEGQPQLLLEHPATPRRRRQPRWLQCRWRGWLQSWCRRHSHGTRWESGESG